MASFIGSRNRYYVRGRTVERLTKYGIILLFTDGPTVDDPQVECGGAPRVLLLSHGGTRTCRSA